MAGNDNWMPFAVCTLAVWRVTHMLVSEDGPWNLITRLRHRAGDGFWGQLMDCFYCASLWISAPAALCVAANAREWVLSWLAISGAACLLERSGRKDL